MKKSFKLLFWVPAFVLALAAVSYGGFKLLERSLIDENEALVHSVAQSLLPALLVNDNQKVETLLKTLESYPGIESAELISGGGVPLASYARGGQLADPLQQQFELASADDALASGYVHLAAPVSIDTQILANLYIVVNLWPSYLKFMMWIGGLLILCATLYVVVTRLDLKVRFQKNSNLCQGAFGESNFQLDQALSTELADADIRLEYQPIKRLSDGGVFGMEVLVCWFHPSGQTLHLSPAEFLTLAEKGGLFLPFGNWVMETACKQAAVWHHQYGPLVLTMNISTSQLKDTEFSKKIRAICEVAQYPHQLLEFEVSEGDLLRLSDTAPSYVELFVEQGLSLTVDAFGLSSRSTAILENIQIKKIKFHKNLLKKIGHDEQVKSLVQSLSETAVANEIQVMADGVLNADQCDEMQKIGCILGQGTYFDQPLSVKKFTETLHRMQFDLASKFATHSKPKSSLSY